MHVTKKVHARCYVEKDAGTKIQSTRVVINPVIRIVELTVCELLIYSADADRVLLCCCVYDVLVVKDSSELIPKVNRIFYSNSVLLFK